MDEPRRISRIVLDNLYKPYTSYLLLLFIITKYVKLKKEINCKNVNNGKRSWLHYYFPSKLEKIH